MNVCFGDVRFDWESRQLWRAAAEVHVSTKAFELLKLLLERRPNAVSKNDIHGRLWPQTFVSEANLPSLITEIRDAIGDDARKPHYIRTLHGFGYAFAGEAVQEPGPPRTPASERPAASLVSERGRVALREGENVLGREGEGIVALESTTVSRRHARIVMRQGEAVVEDLGSKNGTFVNDVRVTSSVPLADGDRLRMGSVLMTFRLARLSVSTQTQSSAGPIPTQ